MDRRHWISLLTTLCALLLIGCGGKATEPQSCTLNLILSNQSFDLSPVDMVVLLGSDTLVVDSLEVGDQHNFTTYEFEWREGSYVLSASADGDRSSLAEEVLLKGETWCLVSFWYHSSDDKGTLLLSVAYEPFYFASPWRGPA